MLITQSDAEEIPTEELVGISLTPPPPKMLEKYWQSLAVSHQVHIFIGYDS